jgi:hypothetical protein
LRRENRKLLHLVARLSERHSLGEPFEIAIARDDGMTHHPRARVNEQLGEIGCRAARHLAVLDEFVEGLRVVTPDGVVETRRLPGSGAGPNPDRLYCGSEGILGVVTEAWMRLQDRPTFRAQASVRFTGADAFSRGAEAVRLLPGDLALVVGGRDLHGQAAFPAEVLDRELRRDHRPDPLIVGVDPGLIVEHPDLHRLRLRGRAGGCKREKQNGRRDDSSVHGFLPNAAPVAILSQIQARGNRRPVCMNKNRRSRTTIV